MGRILSKQSCRDVLLGLGLLLAALALVVWPGESMSAMKDGLALCGNVILPSLFPFFVLSSLVVELGMSRYLGRLFQPVMAPLFRVNGSCAAALALGFVGGYPVGARTAISLYQNGQCTRTEAERLLAFCNNSGPAFILGVVGAGVFGSGAAGVLLYLGHMAASLLVGVLFRFYRRKEGPSGARGLSPCFQAVRFPLAFTRAVTGSLTAVLNICAFVLFFTVVIRVLTFSGVLSLLARILGVLLAPLGLSQEWARRLLTGALEVSSGVTTLTDGAMAGRLSMAAFMLGWAGLSVHCQVLAFLGDSGLSMGTYLTGKLLHGGVSALLVGVIARLFPLPGSVSECLSQQVAALAALDFHRSLTLSAVSAWILWLLFVCMAVWAARRKKVLTRK